jgi:hypothetical protein
MPTGVTHHTVQAPDEPPRDFIPQIAFPQVNHQPTLGVSSIQEAPQQPRKEIKYAKIAVLSDPMQM